ncbi:MAG: KpsF/GutQ family sugar-phosphate isomerase [Chitinophagaceae bacterium]
MNMQAQIIATALQTINTEAEAINNLKNFVDNQFIEAVSLIHNTKARLVISGIGKSAIIAQKMVATCNSTGTPAVFMHAADAIHGDLGMVNSNDIVIIISKSGESPEITFLVPLILSFGNKLIAICGNSDSFLAKNAHFFINSYVVKEACLNNLAPTSSTTAQMVIGDAMAVCLMDLNNFKDKDFAKFHPGGNLGKRLYLTVGTIAEKNEKPAVAAYAGLKEIIVEISTKRLGITSVIDENNAIIGIITDGDLRRMLEKTNSLNKITAGEIMTKNPKMVAADMLAAEAVEVMKQYDISQLLVHEKGTFFGVVHLHDLMKEGIM